MIGYFPALLFLILLIGFIPERLHAQQTGRDSSSVYKVNKKIEIPISTALLVADYYGFRYLDNKPGLSYEEVQKLDANDIWAFDRIATQQDPSYRERAHDLSDLFLNISVGLPILLGLDRKIRKDWLDLLVLYAETHAINSGIYIVNTSLFNRVRPLVYHHDIPIEERTANETRNSFYSGHVSSTASASFFMAKVFCDYHPGLENKKYWIFGAALIPPSLVGYYRVKAMKHFPTDVIIGGLVGAASGILVPHFHKRKLYHSGLDIQPLLGNTLGLRACYTFK